MQSRGRRVVAVATALVMALSVSWVVLSAPVATAAAHSTARPSHQVASGQTHGLVRAVGKATAHGTARQRVLVRVHYRASVRVTATVRSSNGKARRASAHAVSRARAAAHAISRARAKATAHAISRAPTKAQAKAQARAKARIKARGFAREKARPAARKRARAKALAKARAHARSKAHDRAILKAWAKLPGRAVKVRAVSTATVRVRAVRAARHTTHAHAVMRFSAVSWPGHKGKPVGRATQRGRARATSTARAVRSARAEATASAVSRAPTKALAKAHAYRKARAKAHRHARQKARAHAKAKAIATATKRARAWAHGNARKKALAKARHKARWRARLNRIDPHDPSTWIRTVPRHYTPPTGPRFNNPYGDKAKKRTLLRHVIRTIQSSPGYLLTKDPKTHKRLRCPTNPKFAPSEIKIAVYSIYDKRFAKAIVGAHHRCVSVQVLMNSHLTASTSPSWGSIIHTLGRRHHDWWTQYSFAHRCHNGCIGTSVLHTKMYLFSHAGRAHDIVMTGSSNMTRNAAGVQWNDLFTANNDRHLYYQFRYMFRRMVPGRIARGPFVFHAGRYTSVFYPFRRATSRSDWTMKDLRSIDCKGARGGTGIHGRTVIYIAMHAWFSKRGRYIAREVRNLYNQGCYVRVLYSFMGYGEYRMLKADSGKRMRVRRVLFAGPLGRATKYSHMKMVAVSGVVAGDRRARVVWTGSNNWSLKSLHADEVTLEIKSALVYRRYVKHWKLMERLRSSPTYANFSEPEGGGRAP